MDTNAAFIEKPMLKASLLQRLLGIKPKKNALIELNNLLAHKKVVKDIHPIEIGNIAQQYNVNLQLKYPKEIEEFYSSYLKHCLRDKTLDGLEIDNLTHLKQLLGLNDTAVVRMHNLVAGDIYQESVDDAIKDGRLTEDEKNFLETLKQNLSLPDEIVEKIRRERGTKHVQAYMATIIQDERLSPDEEQELNAIAKSLGAVISFDDKTQQILAEYRLLWLIENDQPPTVEVDINLQKNEKCYAIRDIDWLETRRVRERVKFSGLSMRIPLGKGLSYRIGDYDVTPIYRDVLTTIDSGRLYLTNKRIVFIGENKSSSINLSKVLNFTPYLDGIEIVKGSGKNPVFSFDHGIKIFAMFLHRALRDISTVH